MSLTRQFLREFRPLFRVLEEPFGRPIARSRGSPLSVFNDPFFNNSFPASSALANSFNVPAVDVSEEPNAYVVEAELPGVKKENVELRVGDGGQSLTIEGKTFVRSSTAPPQGEAAGASTEGTPVTEPDESKVVTQNNNQSTQLTSERVFAGESSFSRTIWLPRRVDPSNVSAKLEDGILRVRVPKAEDPESVKVNIE